MKNPIPKFIADRYAYGALGFRQEHRSALKQAMRHLKDAQNGCTYSPAYKHLHAAMSSLEKAIECVRVKNWDRGSPGKEAKP